MAGLIQAGAAEYLMARDAENLVATARDGVARIEVYHFSPPAVTAGRNARVTGEEITRWHRYGHDFARRPTGGGILRHGDDLAFGVVLAIDESDRMTPAACFIARVAGAVADALLEQGIGTEASGAVASPPVHCFAAPIGSELIYRGRKILGLAARRIRGAILVQGSLAVGRNPELDLRLLGEGPGVSLDRTTFDASRFSVGLKRRLLSSSC